MIICSNCGSAEVQVVEWIKANARTVVNGDPFAGSTDHHYWCDECDDHTAQVEISNGEHLVLWLTSLGFSAWGTGGGCATIGLDMECGRQLCIGSGDDIAFVPKSDDTRATISVYAKNGPEIESGAYPINEAVERIEAWLTASGVAKDVADEMARGLEEARNRLLSVANYRDTAPDSAAVSVRLGDLRALLDGTSR